KAPDADEVEGVNTRAELADAAAFLRARVNNEHMLAGVTIVDPQTTWIEPDVELEPDSTIHPFTVLRGRTRVAAGAEVGPHAVVVDAEIGRNVRTGIHNGFEAPVEIGDEAWIAGGAYITEDVPPESLAGFPPKQITKEGYLRGKRND